VEYVEGIGNEFRELLWYWQKSGNEGITAWNGQAAKIN